MSILLSKPIYATSYALNYPFDYTAMTKSDAHNLIASLGAGNYTITNDPRGYQSWLYQDMGANYFSGDLLFRTSVYLTSSTSASNYQGILVLTNGIYGFNTGTTSSEELYTAISQGIFIRYTSSAWSINLYYSSTATGYTASATTWYYLEYARTGTTQTLKIYSTPAFDAPHLLQTLTQTSVLTTSWRYVMGWDAMYYSTGSGAQSIKVGQLSCNAISYITITSSPTGANYLAVDGTNVTTPHTFVWIPANTHTLEAYSYNGRINAQVQYIYSSWSDSGAQSHTYTVPMGNATVTATFQKQYYLTVTGGSSPTGQGWYNDGVNANPSNAWIWGTSGGTRTALFNWQLDGSNQNPARHNTGTFTTPNIAMTNYHVANFVSVTQYYNTFVNTITELTSGQSGSQTSDNWYDSGTDSTVSVTNGNVGYIPFTFKDFVWSIGGVAQANSTFNPFIITMSNYVSITAYWETAVTVIVAGNSSINADGSHVTTPHTYTYYAGSSHWITSNSTSVGVTLTVNGNATITLDGTPVVTPHIYNLIDGTAHTILAIGGSITGGGFGTGLFIGLFITVLGIVLMLAIRVEGEGVDKNGKKEKKKTQFQFWW